MFWTIFIDFFPNFYGRQISENILSKIFFLIKTQNYCKRPKFFQNIILLLKKFLILQNKNWLNISIVLFIFAILFAEYVFSNYISLPPFTALFYLFFKGREAARYYPLKICIKWSKFCYIKKKIFAS